MSFVLALVRAFAAALSSTTPSNVAFPNVVPGFSFNGYDTPFTWKNVSPRAGVTYALTEPRKTVARASFSRYAGQLDIPGYSTDYSGLELSVMKRLSNRVGASARFRDLFVQPG